MPQRLPATPRISATSATVALPGGEAGRGLEKVCAGLDGEFRGAKFFLGAQQAGFQDDFEQRAVMMGHGDGGMKGVLHGVVVAALELADGDDHVELARAQAERARRLPGAAWKPATRRAGKPMTTPTGMPVPASRLTAVAAQTGLTTADAKR